MHEDNLTLQTPEQVELHLELAGVGSRLLAAVVDSLLQVLVLLGLGLALGAVRWVTSGDLSRLGANLAIAGGAAVLVVIAYHTVLETLWAGQTPGKRLAGLAVVRDDGGPAGIGEVLVRNVLRVVDFLPAFYALGLVVLFVGRGGKRIGDIAAGTVVVKAGHAEAGDLEAALGEETEAPRPDAAVPALRACRIVITPQEAAAVARYLERRHELPPESRRELALRLAEATRSRFPGLLPGELSDPEAYLEALHRSWRE